MGGSYLRQSLSVPCGCHGGSLLRDCGRVNEEDRLVSPCRGNPDASSSELGHSSAGQPAGEPGVVGAFADLGGCPGGQLPSWSPEFWRRTAPGRQHYHRSLRLVVSLTRLVSRATWRLGRSDLPFSCSEVSCENAGGEGNSPPLGGSPPRFLLYRREDLECTRASSTLDQPRTRVGTSLGLTLVCSSCRLSSPHFCFSPHRPPPDFKPLAR